MIIDEAFDTDKFIEFLQALIKDAGEKVFLILNYLRMHHSKLVKAWVAQRGAGAGDGQAGACACMARLEQDPERDMRYFQDRSVRYVA